MAQASSTGLDWKDCPTLSRSFPDNKSLSHLSILVRRIGVYPERSIASYSLDFEYGRGQPTARWTSLCFLKLLSMVSKLFRIRGMPSRLLAAHDLFDCDLLPRIRSTSSQLCQALGRFAKRGLQKAGCDPFERANVKPVSTSAATAKALGGLFAVTVGGAWSTSRQTLQPLSIARGLSHGRSRFTTASASTTPSALPPRQPVTGRYRSLSPSGAQIKNEIDFNLGAACVFPPGGKRRQGRTTASIVKRPNFTPSC